MRINIKHLVKLRALALFGGVVSLMSSWHYMMRDGNTDTFCDQYKEAITDANTNVRSFAEGTVNWNSDVQNSQRKAKFEEAANEIVVDIQSMLAQEGNWKFLTPAQIEQLSGVRAKIDKLIGSAQSERDTILITKILSDKIGDIQVNDKNDNELSMLSLILGALFVGLHAGISSGNDDKDKPGGGGKKNWTDKQGKGASNIITPVWRTY